MAGHQLLRGAMQTKMSTRRLASGRKPLAATAKLASRVNTRVSTVQKPIARPAPVPPPVPEPAPVPEPKQAPPASLPQVQQPRARPNFILPSQVVAFILGGGQGADLYPLTQSRAEPAVPLFGSYRLIDIIVSNCLNSSVQKVYVLTQFNSRPLNRHLSQAYINVGTVGLGPEGGFVEPLNATLTARKDKNGDWFRGTADAVRQYLWMLEDPQTSEVEEVLVLCGDQIYQMDYSQIIAQHRQTDADVTLAVIPCAKQSASQYGVLELDDQMRVQGFYEKPEAAVLNRLRPTTSLASVSSLASVADLPAEDAYAANMGVYVFKRDVLERLLQQQFPDAVDFSRDVLAPAARSLDIRAFEFTGYWRDVGSLKSYYETSMSLIRDHSAGSALQLWDSVTPVYTAPRVLPPAKLRDAEIESSLVAQGCCIQGATIRHSILGDCTRVGPGSLIEDTITFGADWYEFPGEPVMDAAAEHPLGIGPGCTIRRAILDKNVRLGRNVQLVNRGGVREAAREAEGFVIRDGIICVLKNATLPDNFVV